MLTLEIWTFVFRSMEYQIDGSSSSLEIQYSSLMLVLVVILPLSKFQIFCISESQDKQSGENEDCYSCTSSNRESWGRCSSLGSDNEISTDFVGAASGNQVLHFCSHSDNQI